MIEFPCRAPHLGRPRLWVSNLASVIGSRSSNNSLRFYVQQHFARCQWSVMTFPESVGLSYQWVDIGPEACVSSPIRS